MKLRNAIAILLLIAGITHASGESKNYSRGLEPGELYFVTMTNFSGGSLVWTNQERFIWYPAKVTSLYSTAQSSTNTLTIIYALVDQQFLETQVITNEFGNVQTNYLHQLTNTVTTFVTNNAVMTWTNSADTQASGTTENEWIQRDDIVSFAMGITNEVWLKIIGRR